MIVHLTARYGNVLHFSWSFYKPTQNKPKAWRTQSTPANGTMLFRLVNILDQIVDLYNFAAELAWIMSIRSNNDFGQRSIEWSYIYHMTALEMADFAMKAKSDVRSQGFFSHLFSSSSSIQRWCFYFFISQLLLNYLLRFTRQLNAS